MATRRAKPRVVSVSAPEPPKPKLTPFPSGRRINFWHPKSGMYQGIIRSVDEQNDLYKVELHSGKIVQVKGEWIKTRRPDNVN